MRKYNNFEITILRKKAEERLKDKLFKSDLALTQSESLKRMHEAEFCQIELEMQNEALSVALAKIEHSNHLLLEHLLDGVVIHKPDTSIRFANEQASTLLGVTQDQLMGKKAINPAWCFCRRDRTIMPVNEYPVARVIATLAPVRFMELGIIRPAANDLVWVLINAFPEFNTKGELLQVVVTFMDITDRKLAEIAIQKSEEKFRGIFENMQDVYYEMSMDGILLEISPSIKIISKGQYQREELIGKSIIELYTIKEGRASFLSAIKENSSVTEFELTLQNKDGSSVPCSISSKLIYDKLGQPVKIIGSIRDNSIRNQAEIALRRSEAIQQKMVSNIGDVITIIDANEIISYKSPSIERCFGWKPEEVVGSSTWINIHPEDRFHLKKFINSLIGEPNATGTTECRYLCKDGSYKWIEISMVNLLHDPDIKGILGNHRDITERKKSEKKLKLLSKAIEQSPVTVIITDKDGIIEYVNAKFTDLTGYTLDESKGKNPRILQSGLHTKEFYKTLWDTISSGNDWQGEFMNKKKNGDVYLESALISPILDIQGNITNFIAVKEDITEKKKTLDDLIKAKEKAEESNHLKTAFLATMNHELRTPLNHILGFSELIMSSVSPEENVGFASNIYTSGQNLLSIIEDVFNLASLERTNIKIRKQTYSLIDHFMENKASFDNILIHSGKNEQIHLIYKPDIQWLSSYVTADRSKINQILTNLFKNAVKFTNHGIIEYGFKVDNKANVMFYIKDTGIGIPEDKQAIIFDLFRQGDDSITRTYGGVGVGLAISQKIAEILNGELKVISEPNVGSTFSLTIPVELT